MQGGPKCAWCSFVTIDYGKCISQGGLGVCTERFVDRCAGPEPFDFRNVVIIVVSVIASLWVLNVAAIALFAHKTVCVTAVSSPLYYICHR